MKKAPIVDKFDFDGVKLRFALRMKRKFGDFFIEKDRISVSTSEKISSMLGIQPTGSGKQHTRWLIDNIEQYQIIRDYCENNS
jgi:hypothetical protein